MPEAEPPAVLSEVFLPEARGLAGGPAPGTAGPGPEPKDVLRGLVLTLMGRTLCTRGVGALVESGRGLCVAVVRGRPGVREGETLDADVPPAEAEGAAAPPALGRLGLGLVVPLWHGGEPVGLVALGGEPAAARNEASGGEGAEARRPAGLRAARGLARTAAASIGALQAAAREREARRALAARAHELETLYELARAFGQTLGREAVLKKLGFALMGQLLVTRYVVALTGPDGALAPADSRGVDAAALTLPARLLALDAPAALGTTDLGGGALGLDWAIPLRAGRETRGILLVGRRATGEPLGRADVALAEALGALATGALETTALVAEAVARERQAEEMRLARRIQERLLPSAPAGAVMPGLDLAVRWRPHDAVSGDTFEWAVLPGGRLLVAVADVAGKGAGAALLMASVQAGLRLLRDTLGGGGGASEGEAPALAEATGRLNRLLCESTDAAQFVTLAWAVFEPARARVHYVLAGHPPLLVRRSGPGGPVDALGEGGPLLGVLPEASFIQGEAPFEPGDLALFYTDGLSEARAPGAGEDGTEVEFGDGPLAEAFAGAPTEAAAALGSLAEALGAFTGAPPTDDLTLVAVRGLAREGYRPRAGRGGLRGEGAGS